MCIVRSPPMNRVIGGLPNDVRLRWARHLEAVRLPRGLALHEPGDAMGFAYFPTTAVVSIACVTAEGKSMELVTVGNEGMVGIELLLGGGSMPHRVSVVSPGEALCLPAGLLQCEMARFGPAAHLLLRYILVLTAQVAQSAVCNRHHSLSERLCRWLLMSLDRSQDNEIKATHRQIAFALGVRREGVSGEAMRLQSEGLISYVRGHIEVLDRAGLEEQVCECYGVVQKEFGRLMPDAQPTRLPMANFRGEPVTRQHQTWIPLPQ